MEKISYEDAIELLLDIENYRDYVLANDNALIGGLVGKENIIKHLWEHKDELYVSDVEFFKVGNFDMCLGITYTQVFKEQTASMYIPVDYSKLIKYLNK